LSLVSHSAGKKRGDSRARSAEKNKDKRSVGREGGQGVLPSTKEREKFSRRKKGRIKPVTRRDEKMIVLGRKGSRGKTRLFFVKEKRRGEERVHTLRPFRKGGPVEKRGGKTTLHPAEKRTRGHRPKGRGRHKRRT